MTFPGGLLLGVLVAVLGLCAFGESSLENRTRMVVDDGHLVFQAPEDKNISFRTSSGRGGILLNGNDVLEILNSVTEVSRVLTPIASSGQVSTHCRQFFFCFAHSRYFCNLKSGALETVLRRREAQIIFHYR